MGDKVCKKCGKSMDIEDPYDTCENCRTKDAENKRNIGMIALGIVTVIGAIENFVSIFTSFLKIYVLLYHILVSDTSTS